MSGYVKQAVYLLFTRVSHLAVLCWTSTGLTTAGLNKSALLVGTSPNKDRDDKTKLD